MAITIRQGDSADFNGGAQLITGEPALCNDTEDIYVRTQSQKVRRVFSPAMEVLDSEWAEIYSLLGLTPDE